MLTSANLNIVKKRLPIPYVQMECSVNQGCGPPSGAQASRVLLSPRAQGRRPSLGKKIVPPVEGPSPLARATQTSGPPE